MIIKPLSLILGIGFYINAYGAEFPMDCFLEASHLNLTVHQRILLCTNAKSLDPIQCLKQVSGPLTDDQRINLCQGATSKAPEECFEEVREFELSPDERTKLCNTAVFINNSIQSREGIKTGSALCFRKSNHLPLSQDQKVILCADADSDDPVRCWVRTDDQSLSGDQRVRLCTQLAPSGW